MSLVDIGVNLMGRQFKNRKAVVERAQDAGVNQIVITGTSDKVSTGAADLAKTMPGVLYATAGVHPHNAKDYVPDITCALLAGLADRPEVVAIGECGLDFNRMLSNSNKQMQAFEAQLQIAANTGLPVFLHERDAFETFHRTLAKWRPKLSGAVVHCFTGEQEALRAYLDLDCHIGITGWICDERRGHHLRSLVKEIPADRLMVETDAPWLTPRDLDPRPRWNEPQYLPHIVGHVAECVGKPVDQVIRETTAVAQSFFGLT